MTKLKTKDPVRKHRYASIGAESFLTKVRRILEGRQESLEQPALAALQRAGLPSASSLEEAVEEIFGQETPRRRGRLKLYALRRYSGLTATAIGQRYGRRHSAVSMAVKAIESEALKSPDSARRLALLAETVTRRSDK